MGYVLAPGATRNVIFDRFMFGSISLGIAIAVWLSAHVLREITNEVHENTKQLRDRERAIERNSTSVERCLEDLRETRRVVASLRGRVIKLEAQSENSRR